jgi:HAD superfamily hydrolase (TIGR01509 family)
MLESSVLSRLAGADPAQTARCSGVLPHPVQGLLFDMGDVLCDATLWRRWLLQLLGRLGLHTHYRSFFYIWDHDYLVDVHCGQRVFGEAFSAFLLSAGLSRGQIDEVQAACKTRRDQWEATARLLPGVKSTLYRLHGQQLTLGVLSDSEHSGEVLASRLERLGLHGLFTAVVSSVDIGRTKPDPTCYQTALEAMRMDRDRVAYVGHDAEELAGAARFGLTTIAFNYDQESQADVYLHRFEGLLDLLPAPSSFAAAG